MAAIDALREETPMAPAAGVCERHQVIAYPVSDTTGAYGSLPPDGSFRAEVTDDDLVARGADTDWATANAGTMTWTLAGDTVTQQVDGPGPCPGTASSRGGAFVTLVTDDGDQPCDLSLSFVWRPTADGIAFVLVAPEQQWTLDDFTSVQAHLERDRVRIDGPMPSIPPPDYAGLNAGTWTWTFSDGAWSAMHDVRNEQCHGVVTVADDHLELGDTPTEPCSMAYDLRWRPEGDGIRLEVTGLDRGPETPAAMADERAFINPIWSRIDGPIPSTAPGAAFIGDRLPPDGTYRTEITREDLLARGASAEYAAKNASIITWTFTGGTSEMLWDTGPSTVRCHPESSTVEGVVRLVFAGNDGCAQDTIDLRWTVEGDRLMFKVLAASTPKDLIEDRAWLERPWARVQ